MDSSGMDVLCKNSTFGCVFVSSSVEDMVNHFQGECPFHPLQWFKCSRMVPKMNFAKHYEQCCKDSSTSLCPPPKEAPDAAEAKASATAISLQDHFPRECATECSVCVKSLCSAMKDAAADVADVKVMKEKQQDLEVIVKGQGDVIQELSKSISMVVEKVNSLKKDVGTIVKHAQNVDVLVKDCNKESKLGAKRLSRVMRNVAAGVAEVKEIKEKQQDMEATLKQQGDLIKELGKNMLTNAEKASEVEQGVETIVQRVEKLDGLVKEVRALTHSPAGQSKIHWYVENVSQHIEKAKTDRSLVYSDVFVVRGYSARLWFEVGKRETGPCIELFLLLWRGPNDSLLQWPFRIPYTLSLIHPKDASKSKHLKATPPAGFPEGFEKPKKGENIGLGGTLCTVQAARNEGFMENDAACFALTLHD